MKITIHHGEVKDQPTFRWEQVTQREGVYMETGGATHLRFVTCKITNNYKTAVVNLSTNTISKTYSYNHLSKYIEAEPLTITFTND